MKKRIATIIVGLLTMTLLAGCSGNGEISNDNITIKKYKGLEIEKVEATEVTDAAVEASIKSDLEILGTEVEVTDRAAELGDTVTIDFVGKMGGVAFDGGTGNDQELELGSNTFIDGFEEGIVGHNIGETFDLNLTFPDNYKNAELAGQDVVFTVTLDKITSLQLPELTDELLPQIGTSAKTVDEYKESVKKSLQESNEATAKTEMITAILEELVLNCEVKEYPEDVLIDVTKKFVFQESYLALMSGISIDDSVYNNYQLTVKVKVKELATQEMAIELISEKENIVVTLEEYESEVQTLANAYGATDLNTFVSDYESVYGEGYIRSELLKSKVAAFLLDNCKYVESK